MFELLLSNLKYDPPAPSGVEFLGEVGVTDFIDGEELASRIGLTGGTAQYTDSPWLHFILDDVELYVAKKPYRHSVSWSSIDAVGAVFGTKTVVINGKTYKVRLLKSVVSSDRYTGSNSVFDPIQAYGSEWNRLMYPIHSGKHTSINNPSPVSGEGIRLGTLAQYTDADLVTYPTLGNGAYSWCQEARGGNARERVTRGGFGVSHLYWFQDSHAYSNAGWRPVLELVP